MHLNYLLILPILIVLFAMYLAGVFYLLRREPKHFNSDYDSKIRFERIQSQYTSPQAYEEAELILKKDPQNQEVRADILTAHFIDPEKYPIEKVCEHAWWFLENAPLNLILSSEGKTMLLLGAKSEDERNGVEARTVSTWTKHLLTHPKNIFYLRAAAKFLNVISKDESKKIWMQLNQEYPFCSKSLREISILEKWSSASEVLYKHPTPEYKKAYTLAIKSIRRPWDEVNSSKLAQLKFRYGKILLPNWLCFLTLYVDGILNWRYRPWNDYYIVSHTGMLAFQCGDYSFAKKCSEQFLKLQPNAQAQHNHLPLYATGFNLAAMLALREENFQLLDTFIEKRAEDEADSIYAFHADIDFLIEVIRVGRSDIAINFMKKRARNYLTDPDIIAEIAYVENGGRIYSEEYYKWSKDNYDAVNP